MTSPVMNRRGFLLANASVLGAGGLAQAMPDPKRTWANAAARDLKPLIGDVFTARHADGSRLALTLTGVETRRSGWARPVSLPRSETVIADFKCADMARFIEEGDQTLRLSHPQLGEIDAYIGVTPRRDGKYDLELVLS